MGVIYSERHLKWLSDSFEELLISHLKNLGVHYHNLNVFIRESTDGSQVLATSEIWWDSNSADSFTFFVVGDNDGSVEFIKKSAKLSALQLQKKLWKRCGAQDQIDFLMENLELLLEGDDHG